MTEILTWNIQNGKGADEKISLERIASVIKEMADPDVICLQEVSRSLPLEDGEAAADQIAELSELFSGYEVIFGAAVDARGKEGRWQFGNATLTRLPVCSLFQHPLPQPSEPGIKHMPRQAIEITVASAFGPLRIVNTHLEFHSASQRLAQVGRLRSINAEIVANNSSPPLAQHDGPYQTFERPMGCILCGDFNMEIDSTEYSIMLNGNGHEQLIDAWRVLHPYDEHDPTCGIFDHVQWPQGAHCRDFFFVSGALSTSLREITVNISTNASDHQPVLLKLESGSEIAP